MELGQAVLVARVAREVFGVEGLVTLLPGDRDLNARVGQHILKIHEAGADPADLDLQDAALAKLAGSEAGAIVARVRPPISEPFVDLAGERRAVRMLEWSDGRVLADVAPQSLGLLRDLGRSLAKIDEGLAGFSHPARHRHSHWNLVNLPGLVEFLPHVTDAARRTACETVIRHHIEVVAPALAKLPGQVIHGDVNDYNVIVGDDDRVRAIIDFGDLMTAPRVCDLAIAAAYATFAQPDPIRGILPLIAGYHEVAPLVSEELALLQPLICGRLAASLVMQAHERSRQPANDYLLVSQDDAWRVLQVLLAGSADLAHYRFRDACGYEAHPRSSDVLTWLTEVADPAPVLSAPLGELAPVTLDWSVDASEEATSAAGVAAAMSVAGAAVAVGRYGEDRAVYRTPQFVNPVTGEARSIHLGVDLFVPAGEPIHAPLAGVVRAFGDNLAALDYGPVVVLEHETANGTRFYTLYGHLARESLVGLRNGTVVSRGEGFATVGSESVNGGWPPHVHLQLLMDLVGLELDVPGVAAPSEARLWKSLSPDPLLLFLEPRHDPIA